MMQDDIRDRYKSNRRDYKTTPLRRSEPAPMAPVQAAQPAIKAKETSKSRWLFSLLGVLIIIALAAGAWFWHPKNSGAVDPFNTEILAATKFTLYYPTRLPAGFHTDTKSVTAPHAGVVVFDLINSKSQKIYISQELRPQSFDFGGYYKNFSDLDETVTPNGTIAVGRINNGQTEIASLALSTDKTWILANTSASVPSDQLTDMLRSLSNTH